MNALELIESFSEFKEFKNIDRETMMNILQDVFRSIRAVAHGTTRAHTAHPSLQDR